MSHNPHFNFKCNKTALNETSQELAEQIVVHRYSITQFQLLCRSGSQGRNTLKRRKLSCNTIHSFFFKMKSDNSNAWLEQTKCENVRRAKNSQYDWRNCDECRAFCSDCDVRLAVMRHDERNDNFTKEQKRRIHASHSSFSWRPSSSSNQVLPSSRYT